jgi:hypothetical protein
MPQVGFEPMIPVFERAKTVHTLDREATVIGYPHNLAQNQFYYRASTCLLFAQTDSIQYVS